MEVPRILKFKNENPGTLSLFIMLTFLVDFLGHFPSHLGVVRCQWYLTLSSSSYRRMYLVL